MTQIYFTIFYSLPWYIISICINFMTLLRMRQLYPLRTHADCRIEKKTQK